MTANWTAIVLTCANKNSSIAYEKELKLKQRKGIISSDTIILCVEDPEKPIGSGGATLNALLIVAEALSARKKFRMTQVEVLQDTYILIVHMGRQYPFDVCSKGFCTLPVQDKSTRCPLTNFDLLFHTMSYQIARYEEGGFKSDPGVYICSSDIIFLLPHSEKILIKNKPICALVSLADRDVVKKNGIYHIDDLNNEVKNIHFQPDDSILSRVSAKNGLYHLISGIVYLDHQISKILFNLLFFPPLDSCNYIGIDSGASPLCLSLFFDVLLSCCDGISKEEYLAGSFKTNHNVPVNQLALLKQARATLWANLHNFKVSSIVFEKNVHHLYMDNETLQHRTSIFGNFKLFSDVESSFATLENEHNSGICSFNTLLTNSVVEKTDSNSTSSDGRTILLNTILENSQLKLKKNVTIANCRFSACKLSIGENTHISDLIMESNVKNIPSNLFIQNVSVKLESLCAETDLHIVFGVEDNLSQIFKPEDAKNWKIMNEPWIEFSSRTQIVDSDLWPADAVDANERTLFNAKLYPIFNSTSSKEEMTYLSRYFLIDLTRVDFQNASMVKKWRQSVRLSLENIGSIVRLESLFDNRRKLFNTVNVNYLIESILANRPIEFNRIIAHSIRDGCGEQILSLLDEHALKNAHDLMLLPRLMIFMSNTLCEMATHLSIVRSGPGLNVNWLNAFKFIENGQIEQALCELSKERKNWMDRPDLIIRAARHYEGAMLAFIRQATSSFKTNDPSSNRIILNKIANKQDYNWVTVRCPARLDLAGAWSDTPPITYECKGGSCVTNVAILVNNKMPIGAKGRIVRPKTQYDTKLNIKIVMKDYGDDDDEDGKITLTFTDLDELKDYHKPQAQACLMKAVFVFTKLIEFNSTSLQHQLERKLNGSLELHTWTGLPQGSGLGTSSILIGCVLKVVWYLMGIDVSNETLSYSILIVEQIMTTNGGWQDQIGGIWGGFKLTTAKNQLPLEISVQTLQLDDQFLDEINARLVLIYTGITRLAKDLLLNVLRNWYAISQFIYDNVDQLVRNGFNCSDALNNRNIMEFGECINRHRKQKLIMAPESEPGSVQQLMKLIEPYVYGMALAGAGGGGFLYALTRERNFSNELESLLHKSSSNLTNMKVYHVQVATNGIELNLT